jgi:hypothetical protein
MSRRLSGAGQGRYSWDEVADESRRQQEQRRPQTGAAAWVAPLALTRWSALLRIVGQLLDARRVTAACVLDTTLATPDNPRDYQVRVLVNDEVVVDGDDVQVHLLRVRTQQIAGQQPPAPPEHAESRRPWWAVWRRD